MHIHCNRNHCNANYDFRFYESYENCENDAKNVLQNAKIALNQKNVAIWNCDVLIHQMLSLRHQVKVNFASFHYLQNQKQTEQ